MKYTYEDIIRIFPTIEVLDLAVNTILKHYGVTRDAYDRRIEKSTKEFYMTNPERSKMDKWLDNFSSGDYSIYNIIKNNDVKRVQRSDVQWVVNEYMKLPESARVTSMITGLL